MPVPIPVLPPFAPPEQAGRPTARAGGAAVQQERVETLKALRQLLSANHNPPLGAAVRCGAVPLLAECLAFGAPEEQLLEAAWCVTNIASGEAEETRAVLPCAALLIAHCTDSPSPAIAEQCVWAVGNIAAEADDLRAQLLDQGALPALTRLLLAAASGASGGNTGARWLTAQAPSALASLAKTVAWALSSLIKGPSPRAAVDLVKSDGVDAAIVTLLSSGNAEAAVEAAWVAAYVTALSDASAERLVAAGLMEALVPLLSATTDVALLTPVVRAIGNLTAGDSSRTTRLLTAGTPFQAQPIPASAPPGAVAAAAVGPGLSGLAECLENKHHGLKKETAWAVSNMTAGDSWQKAAVIGGDTGGMGEAGKASRLYELLVHLLRTSPFDIKREVAFALANLCVDPAEQEPMGERHVAVQQSRVAALVDAGCLPPFLSLIRSADADAVRLGLQFTEVVLRVLPDKRGPRLVEEADGIDAIEAAQFVGNEELHSMSSYLVDTYFGEEYGLEEGGSRLPRTIMEQSPEDPYATRGIAKLSKSKSYDRWLLDPQKPSKGLQQPPPNRMGQWAAIAVACLLFSLILLNPTVVDDTLSIMMRPINPSHVDVFTRGLATLQWWEDQYPPPLSPPENVELKEQQPGHILWKTFRITRVAAFNVDRRIIKQTKQAGFQLVPLAAPPLLKDLTWDDIFADRFDEDSNAQCPKLPLPEWSQDLRTVDALIAHMPCQPVNGSFARDVRWHQLVLAVAEYVKQSARPWMPVVVLSDCRPPPNLFHCNRLVHRDGPVWLFNLTVADMRRRLQPVGNCALATPEPQLLPGQLPDQQPAAARRLAYATVLHSKEDYVCGAIALANSLRRSGTRAELVALVSAEIGNFSRGGLEAAGWRLIEIERIRNPFGRAGTYNQWNYSKLRLWQLTEYAKVVFVDADILVLRNMDHLFEYPELSARSNSRRFFNSGVMVIEPSQCTFELMMENTELIQSYNGGDQGFVNDVFYWWHRLPKSINTLKYINADDGPKRELETETLDSLIASDPPTIHALHFLGKKPWRCYRDFDCNIVMNTHRRFVHHGAHKLWYTLHDSMSEELQAHCLPKNNDKAGIEYRMELLMEENQPPELWNFTLTDPRREMCAPQQSHCKWKNNLKGFRKNKKKDMAKDREREEKMREEKMREEHRN
ncbi:unnamed protein product [Closterium sp. NIES-54]